MNQNRKQLIKEWIDKAEADYEVALSLHKSKRKKKIYYIVAFHCQQAIEKYFKALLLCNKIDFPKIHDLIQLLKSVQKKDPFLNILEKDLALLNPFAVGFRYPGEDIEAKELNEVIITTKRTRKILFKRIKEFL